MDRPKISHQSGQTSYGIIGLLLLMMLVAGAIDAKWGEHEPSASTCGRPAP